MKKWNIQLVFHEEDSLWYASYSTFESLPFVRDKRKKIHWWYLDKDKCDAALLSRVTGSIECVDGWEIESVSYDSKERVNYDRSFT